MKIQDSKSFPSYSCNILFVCLLLILPENWNTRLDRSTSHVLQNWGACHISACMLSFRFLTQFSQKFARISIGLKSAKSLSHDWLEQSECRKNLSKDIVSSLPRRQVLNFSGDTRLCLPSLFTLHKPFGHRSQSQYFLIFLATSPQDTCLLCPLLVLMKVSHHLYTSYTIHRCSLAWKIFTDVEAHYVSSWIHFCH